MNGRINGLIEEAIRHGLITPRDTVYCRNRLLDLLQVKPLATGRAAGTIPELLEWITEEAAATGLIESFLEEKEILAAKLMDVFV